MSVPRVEMVKIDKSFGGVHALRGVTLEVEPGEIHALVGENGAGKSTLMKILAGAYRMDAGRILIDGKVTNISNPHAGRKAGIAIIYQELALAPDLTVAENIFLSHLGVRKGFIQWKKLFADARTLLETTGFVINPKARVRDLSIAYQQVVEIAKALSENARILILDEPTAVLAPSETRLLFDALRRLRSQGVSIVYISHRLDEIFQIADRITVLKDGEVTGTVLKDNTDADSVVNMMIGRKLSSMYPKRTSAIGEEVLRVQNLFRGRHVQDVSFSVCAGEVLGIAGLVGSGRTETVRALFGADLATSGDVILSGNSLRIRRPSDAVGAGIGLVPEDRKAQGSVLSMSVRANVSMPSLCRTFSRFGWILRGKEVRESRNLIDRLGIRTEGTETTVNSLSGGNQQKVVLAKWLSSECRVLVLDEPTRGVDVGAKVEIYELINELAGEGIGIVMVSSEIMEIIGMCDRVLVMREGKVQGSLKGEELTEEAIMNLAIQRKSA